MSKLRKNIKAGDRVFLRKDTQVTCLAVTPSTGEFDLDAKPFPRGSSGKAATSYVCKGDGVQRVLVDFGSGWHRILEVQDVLMSPPKDVG